MAKKSVSKSRPKGKPSPRPAAARVARARKAQPADAELKRNDSNSGQRSKRADGQESPNKPSKPRLTRDEEANDRDPYGDQDADPDEQPVSRPVGRPRSELPALPIYDSIAQCSAATGIPQAVLKKAKRAGCVGFRSNRVDLARVLPFIFALDGSEDWKDVGAKWSALNEQLDYERRKEIVVEKDPVGRGIQGAEAVLFGALDRTFLSELPPLLKGKDEAAIRAECLAKIEGMKTQLRADLTAALKAGKCK